MFVTCAMTFLQLMKFPEGAESTEVVSVQESFPQTCSISGWLTKLYSITFINLHFNHNTTGTLDECQ